MEELGSIWSYQEGMDELKQKLIYATLELDSVRMQANEEMRKNKENVKQLLGMLKVAYQERDEARDQLQKMLNKLLPSSPHELQTILPLHLQPESPLLKPTKANSSITESNSLSETYNPQADSFFDAVSSPDFSNINMVDSKNMGFLNQSFVQDYNVSMSKVEIDRGSAIINNLVKGKNLPQKGKFLQSVMEAGPLLQTLLVAGPLPRWRNPPPLQSFRIPPVSIKGCEPANSSYVDQKPLNSSPYIEMSRGFSQMCSTSMLNFIGAAASGSFQNNEIIPIAKRQRFQ